MPNVRDRLAWYAHDAWSRWMQYMFSKCEKCGEAYLIPAESAKRWTRQMSTDYADLPDEERPSDLSEADRILGLLGGP